MSDTVIAEKPGNPKADEWAERIAAQQRSGMSVKQFCKEQGLTEYSFYAWRKRLQECSVSANIAFNKGRVAKLLRRELSRATSLKDIPLHGV